MPARRLAPLAVVVLLVVSACGDGSPAADPGGGSASTPSHGVDLSEVTFSDQTGDATVAVDARDNAFRRDYIEVSPGTTITFRNRGRTDHNALPVETGAFAPIEAADLTPGDEASIVIDEPGEYPYYCSLHGTTTVGMVGAIRVVDDTAP